VVGIADEHQVRQVLTTAAHEFLNELSNFSSKAISPDWLETLEADGEAPHPGEPRGRPSSGQDIAREQEKAKIRRAKKTETMRELRAKRKIA
jgi:hypothetical protein